MVQQDDMNHILNRRAPPPKPSQDLADRIIHAAMRSPRVEKSAWWKNMAGFLNGPARYAIAMGCVALFVVMMYPPKTQTKIQAATDYEFTMVLDVYDDEQWL